MLVIDCYIHYNDYLKKLQKISSKTDIYPFFSYKTPELTETTDCMSARFRQPPSDFPPSDFINNNYQQQHKPQTIIMSHQQNGNAPKQSQCIQVLGSDPEQQHLLKYR